MTPGRPAGSLHPLELALGIPIGIDPTAPRLPFDAAQPDPRAALEQAVVGALERPPCVVSFSGGRDSSAVLAVAAAVARSHGLPPPVPVTARFPRSPATDETPWQELVVGHLGLDTWVRIELDSELDLVGPVAREVLDRHGLLWPANTHFHEPFLRLAAGGSLLTGIDGDGLLSGWHWQRAADVIARRVRPRLRDVRHLAHALAPPSIRLVGERRRTAFDLPWLAAGARGALGEALARDQAAEPATWRSWVEWYAARRSLRLTIDSLDRLAGDHDVVAVHPLAAPAFLAALGRAGGRTGIGDRTTVMRRLFGDLLPSALATRTSKASFAGAFFAEHARAFVERWSGAGLDPATVDVAALRRHWAGATPWAASSSLLQAAWLAVDGDGAPLTAA